MGEWIKRNPVAYALINFALCIVFVVFVIRIYVNTRIDERIINEYQKPIIEKLDILIKLYCEDERK